MSPRLPLLLALAGCLPEDLDGDGLSSTIDCNDADASQGLPILLHIDADGDGWGGEQQELGCPGNTWLVDDRSDCDDDDPSVNPAAVEVGCDGRDNDCAASTPDGPAFTVGQTWASIQAAVDAAGYHEQVGLCASAVHERVTIDRPLTLVGAGVDRTVLDGSGRDGPVLDLRAPVVVRDLTITGGAGRRVGERRIGGGIAISGEGGTVVLERVVVRANAADDGGGIGVFDGGALWMDGGALDANRAGRGGGLSIDPSGSATLIGVSITANVAGIGGGIAADGPLTTSGATFGGNQALDRGGDLWASGPGAITGTALSGGAARTGASIALVGGALVLSDSRVSGAVATDPLGAAVTLTAAGVPATIEVREVTFEGNAPADLRVGDLDAGPAPGPTFSCDTEGGCAP